MQDLEKEDCGDWHLGHSPFPTSSAVFPVPLTSATTKRTQAAAAPPDSGLHCEESHRDPRSTVGGGGKYLSLLAK